MKLFTSENNFTSVCTYGSTFHGPHFGQDIENQAPQIGKFETLKA